MKEIEKRSDMEEQKPSFSNKSYLFPHINKEGLRFGFIALGVTAFFLTLLHVVLIVGTHSTDVFGLSSLGFISAPWFTKFSTCLWCMFLAVFTFLLLLVSYGVFLFFRDPERYQPDDAKAILSPADGRICLIREVPLPEELGESKDEKLWCVSVFMSVFNVHVNRMPTAGEIVRKVYVPGKFLNASLDKASKDNERCNYLVRADNGQVYGVTQIAGLVARRIVSFVEVGARLERIQRFGLIRFGSRLDVYLPKGVKPEVRIGQTMIAGETTLGHLS